jgi:hypothetical protein
MAARHRVPPQVLDILLHLATERAVIEARRQTAVNLRRRKNEAAPLGQRNQLVHHFIGRQTLRLHPRRIGIAHRSNSEVEKFSVTCPPGRAQTANITNSEDLTCWGFWGDSGGLLLNNALSQPAVLGFKVCEIPDLSKDYFEFGFTSFPAEELDVWILTAKDQSDDFKRLTGYFRTKVNTG